MTRNSISDVAQNNYMLTKRTLGSLYGKHIGRLISVMEHGTQILPPVVQGWVFGGLKPTRSTLPVSGDRLLTLVFCFSFCSVFKHWS